MAKSEAVEAKSNDIDPIERAAIFLMSLDEDEAAEVLKHIGPKEVHKLSMAMAALKNVQTDEVNSVIDDFM